MFFFVFQGYAARDWFVFSCSDWKGPDDRIAKRLTVDVNPMLTFFIQQKTIGALVEEEPILYTSK